MLRKDPILDIKILKNEMQCSVEKKAFTVKNTIISTLQKFVVFVGCSTQGSFHDYALLKEEFPPSFDWFSAFENWIDLGYLGIEKDYKGKMRIPHKKTRKSKNNPNPKLTDEQKQENRDMSKVRIFVENAITGIKRFFILTHKFRNKKNNFEDDVIAVAAGLWNLLLA